MTVLTLQERLSVTDILAQHGHYPVKERANSKEAFGFLCPFHADTRPSFWVTGDEQMWNCWSCGGGGVTKLLQLFGDDYHAPPRPAPASKKSKHKGTPFTGCTLAQLAAAKNLPVDYLRSLGWRDVAYGRVPAVAVPWPGGTHYRVNLEGEPKYVWDKGDKVSILGVERLEEVRRGGWALLVEGETDYAAGLLMGLPVIAIPGAATWKNEWAFQFQGCQIYAWQEPGKGGETFTSKLAESFWDINVIDAPDGVKDLCDLHGQAGEGPGDFFLELKAEAKPYRCPASYQADSLPYHHQATGWTRQLDRTRNVPGIVNGSPAIHYPRDKRKKAALWEHARELFPLGGKPWLYGALLGDSDTGKSLWVDSIGTTWRFRPNAQHKRACIYFNMLPRINGRQVYALLIPVDDWDSKVHERVTKRIARAIAKADGDNFGWCWFDNADARGYILYLTNAPGVRDFGPVQDVESTLVDALKAITPPSSGDGGRFRPYSGSDNWTSKLENTGETDQDKWHILAVSNKRVDQAQVEAECVASGGPYEFVHPYWRSQSGRGLLSDMPPEESVKVALDMGWRLTKHGRAVASRMSADGSQRAEDAPHEWGWSAPPDGDGPLLWRSSYDCRCPPERSTGAGDNPGGGRRQSPLPG